MSEFKIRTERGDIAITRDMLVNDHLSPEFARRVFRSGGLEGLPPLGGNMNSVLSESDRQAIIRAAETAVLNHAITIDDLAEVISIAQLVADIGGNAPEVLRAYLLQFQADKPA